MTKILPAFLLAFLCAQLTAQVTLTSDYFPVAGDTLKTDRADSAFAQGIDQLMPGPDLVWNFGEPDPMEDRNEAVVANGADSPFPNADVFIQNNANNTAYYSVSATGFNLVGVTAGTDLLPNFNISTEIAPVRPTRRAPLNYLDEFNTETSNTITISPDSIPQEARELVGDALNSVDSIRITTTSTRNDLVDAYGALSLNGKTHDVLRETRNESVFIKVEFLTGLLGFIDVTGQLELLPAVAPVVGQQPVTITSLYWSPDSKEPIVEVVVSEETGLVQSMTYKRKTNTTSTGGPGFTQARIRVFPNPAINLATFEMEGLERGRYVLSLTNIMGQQMQQREFSPIGNQTRLNLDVSGLPAGLYLYNLRNERGRTITTRKLRVK